jgi:hypothetical protein
MDPQSLQPGQTPPTAQGKDKKKLFLIIIGVAVLMIGLIVAAIMLFTPKEKAPLDGDQVAKEYVDAMVRKDYEKAYSMLNDGPNDYIALKKKIDLATYTKNLEPAPFSPEKCQYTITDRDMQQSSGGYPVAIVEGTLACDETFSIYLEIITTGQYAGIRAYKIDPVKTEQ